MKGKIFALYKDGQLTAAGIVDAIVRGWITGADAVELLGEADGLSAAKDAKIKQSKKDLETYLATHPLLWTDGEYYSITEDKQNQLTATIVAAQVDGEPPEWNSTGLVCKVWDITELSMLGSAIKKRAKALVKYQQTQEIAMNAAETLEALDAIEVDYDTVT